MDFIGDFFVIFLPLKCLFSGLSRVKRKVQKINHTAEEGSLRNFPLERFCFLCRFYFGGRTKWFPSYLYVVLTCMCVISEFIIFARLIDVLEKSFVYGWHVSRFSEHLEYGISWSWSPVSSHNRLMFVSVSSRFFAFLFSAFRAAVFFTSRFCLIATFVS